MGRIFSFLLLITVLLIFAVGAAVHWISSAAVSNTKADAAEEVAKSIALSVSEQVFLLNKTLDRIAHDPEIVAAISHANPAVRESVARTIQSYFPEAMKIRLLLPGITKTDESAVPHMGYADLDMIRETFTKNQLPVVQGDMGPNRHLAMTSPISQGNSVVGVILASLDYDFITKTIKAVELKNYYVELRQDDLVLGKSGIEPSKALSNTGEMDVPRTAWKIYYQYPTGASLGEKARLWLSIIFAILLAVAAYFFGYRRLAQLMKEDLSSVLKAFKDIMTHQSMGSYPVNLAEMNTLISSFLRLKRALEDTDGKIKEDEDELEKNGFFSTPDDFGFSDISIDEDMFDEEILTQQVKVEPPVKKQQPTLVRQTKTMLAEPVDPPPVATARTIEMVKAVPVAQKPDALPSIFKAYDIRGIVGKTLTLNMVYDIGRAFGTEAKNHGCHSIVLGRDGRNSSPVLADELAKGIASTGCGIIDLGMVPTPLLYFAVQHIEGRSGIMVTGSHNPPEYNGFKMMIAGETLAEDRIQDLRECIDSRSYTTGDMGLIEKNDKLASEYVGTIAEDIRIARPMLVVLDCGNGVGGKLGPLLLRTLGCEVIELHCEIDGSFPNHHPDPSKPENMAELSSAVKHYKADLGIAFDGDADRLGVVDCNGKIIWPDRQMMLFAKHVLVGKPGIEIIYDIKCSRHLAEQIKKYGGRPLMWKSGHSLMKAKIKETGAKLAGEMSGHIFFNDRWFGFDDGLYAAARLIEILSNESGSSAQVFAGFPDSINTPELTIDLVNDDGAKLIEAMRAAADFDDATIIDIDGLRIEFSDGWGLVRASNTTPSLTLRFEGDSLEAMQNIQQRFKQLIHKINRDLQLPF
jgi:phosphomannomutase/phosphoglucomutase